MRLCKEKRMCLPFLSVSLAAVGVHTDARPCRTWTRAPASEDRRWRRINSASRSCGANKNVSSQYENQHENQHDKFLFVGLNHFGLPVVAGGGHEAALTHTGGELAARQVRGVGRAGRQRAFTLLRLQISGRFSAFS